MGLFQSKPEEQGIETTIRLLNADNTQYLETMGAIEALYAEKGLQKPWIMTEIQEQNKQTTLQKLIDDEQWDAITEERLERFNNHLRDEYLQPLCDDLFSEQIGMIIDHQHVTDKYQFNQSVLQKLERIGITPTDPHEQASGEAILRQGLALRL